MVYQEPKKGTKMNVDIAERLAKRRREAGYSQENLAEKLGVSRQAISKWERSESSPDTDNLIALAKLYGVSLDDLLYVDEALEDDVEFEAADRAAERTAQASGTVPPSPFADAEGAGPTQGETASESDSAPKEKKVNFSPSGIHVKDGDDYVHVSWREGVHVKDSKDGDEVHVGWDGIHVKERKGKKKGDWFGAGDDEGNTVSWEEGNVVINGKEYDSWRDARDEWGHGVKKDSKAHAWYRFPFPLVVTIAYILLGVFAGVWGPGLFLFLLIPMYYMTVHAVATKKFTSFFAGLYPIVATAWFLYMAFMLNQPHPAWVIFLTIPLVEWLVHSIWRSNKRRKKEAAKNENVIDVEAVSEVESGEK